MTAEQKIREIYPLIPKTEKTFGQSKIVYVFENLKTICILESVRNLNPKEIDQAIKHARKYYEEQHNQDMIVFFKEMMRKYPNHSDFWMNYLNRLS